MSLEITGIRDLSLEEWDCVSGGDGTGAAGSGVSGTGAGADGVQSGASAAVAASSTSPCLVTSNTAVSQADLDAGAMIGTTQCGQYTCFTYSEGGYTDVLPYYVTINGQAAGTYDTSGLCP
jgi:hypothetical protein